MKRNAFLIGAVLLSIASVGVAAEQKQNVDPQQSHPMEQVQVAQKTGDGSTQYASPVKTDCTPAPVNPRKMHSDPEGDPNAPQNLVEYGGGG